MEVLTAAQEYRGITHSLAERAIDTIIQGLPAEIKTIVPVWDQVYLEQFHSGYVDSLDLGAWDRILGLQSM